MHPSLLAVDAIALATAGLALAYHARLALPRPPVGVFVASDVAVMVVILVVLPFAYLRLPGWLVAAVFGVTAFAMLQLGLAPLLGGRWAALGAAALCAAEIALSIVDSPALPPLNDLVLVALTIAVVNLWAQTGMTPGQLAAFAAALTVYDTLATALTSLTSDFVGHLHGLPFAPVVTVGPGAAAAAIGLGDCLLLAAWPVVARRAFGPGAAALAVGVDAALLALLYLGFGTGVLTGAVPVMTALGPLIVAQYAYWRRRTRMLPDHSRDALVPADSLR